MLHRTFETWSLVQVALQSLEDLLLIVVPSILRPRPLAKVAEEDLVSLHARYLVADTVLHQSFSSIKLFCHCLVSRPQELCFKHKHQKVSFDHCTDFFFFPPNFKCEQFQLLVYLFSCIKYKYQRLKISAVLVYTSLMPIILERPL